MAIIFHPSPGLILICDFSTGFIEPEMVKSGRPVLVLTGAIKGRGKLVTIAAMSTVEPNPIMSYHYRLPKSCMPMVGHLQKDDSWVKGDMIYAVGFHRLDLIRLGKRGHDGKRLYFKNTLSRERMKEIYGCVLYGMNLGNLKKHL